MPLFVAGAIFGEVQLSLFVAGAVFREVQLWQVQHLAKFGMIAGARNVVFFTTKCSRRARKGNLGCEAGCGLTVSFSDHGRIGRAL